jgi:hypothetical protein
LRIAAGSNIRAGLETSATVAECHVPAQDQPPQIALVHTPINKVQQWQGKLPGINFQIPCARECFPQGGKYRLGLTRQMYLKVRFHATPRIIVDTGP